MKIIGNKEKGYQKTSSFPGRKEDIKAKEQLNPDDIKEQVEDIEEISEVVEDIEEISEVKETKKNKNKQ